MKGYIYKYTFPDGKVYIGQTKNLLNRKRQHIDPSTGPSCPGFWKAYQKFGRYDFEVIKELDYEDEEELNSFLTRWESGYIHQYKAYNPDFGYNNMSFSIGKNEERTILRRKYEEIFDIIFQDRMDFYFSLENKIWNTKEPLTDDEKKYVSGKFREEIPFNVDFFDFDHLSKNKLNDNERLYLEEYLQCLRNIIYEDTRKYAMYIVCSNKEAIINEEINNTTVVQIDKEGNVVREFHSTAEICQAFNIARADNIRNVLKGKQKTAYGYIWKYKKDL